MRAGGGAATAEASSEEVEMSAEEGYRAAITAGAEVAYYELGQLLESEDRLAEAEEIYRAGIAAGVAGLQVPLGELLSTLEGRTEDAAAACRGAVAAGFPQAYETL